MGSILRTRAIARRVSGTREAWLSMDHVTPELRTQLLSAQVVLGPTRMGDDGTPLFPEVTLSFFRELRASVPPGVTVDILQEDTRYTEWAEHDFIIVIPDLLVSNAVLSVVCGLLSNWIFQKYLSNGSNPSGHWLRFKLFVEGKALEFEGPAHAAPDVLRGFADMEDIPDVTHLLVATEGEDDPH